MFYYVLFFTLAFGVQTPRAPNASTATVHGNLWTIERYMAIEHGRGFAVLHGAETLTTVY